MLMELQHIFYLITFSILFLVFVSKFVKDLKTKNNTRNLPPGPWKLPYIGSMLHFHLVGSPPHHALAELARKYGPLIHLQLGEISAVVISSPRVAKEILKTHDFIFSNRPQLLASQIVFYNNIDIAFSPYGEYWRRMRKICVSEISSAKKVKYFTSIREDVVSRLIDSIDCSSSGSLVDVTEKVFSSTNTIICRATLGECKQQEELTQLIQELLLLLGGFDMEDVFPSIKFLHLVFGKRPKLEKMHQRLDQMLNDIINERKRKLARTKEERGVPTKEDLLEALLRVQESDDIEFYLETKNIKAIIVEMLTAGTEYSSTVVEWAMSEVMRQPRVLEKVQTEVRQTLKGKKKIREADIQGLSYLKLVIKETLRLHPPAPLLLPRQCREQCEINGFTIPFKTKVIVNAWAIGRDPDYWPDDPQSFRPERFEQSSVDYTGDNYEFIPFGAGRRMCPGLALGVANVFLPLAQLLYRFDWKLIPTGMNPSDLDMSEMLGVSARRKNNLCLMATRPSLR